MGLCVNARGQNLELEYTYAFSIDIYLYILCICYIQSKYLIAYLRNYEKASVDTANIPKQIETKKTVSLVYSMIKPGSSLCFTAVDLSPEVTIEMKPMASMSGVRLRLHPHKVGPYQL